jgi:hypothetical protein
MIQRNLKPVSEVPQNMACLVTVAATTRSYSIRITVDIKVAGQSVIAEKLRPLCGVARQMLRQYMIDVEIVEFNVLCAVRARLVICFVEGIPISSILQSHATT